MFRKLNESDQRWVLLMILNGRLGERYRNEEDIRAMIELFAQKVQTVAGVALSEPLVLGAELVGAHKFRNKTPEEKAAILALIREGMSNSQIERVTGVTRRTVANIRREYLQGRDTSSADPMKNTKNNHKGEM